ncbi:MAG: GH92 family glycosyl hydrolase [Acutalibacteraceae bacterium]
MLELLQQVQSIIMIIVILFSSLFVVGTIPITVTMPPLQPGEYGQWVDPFIGTGGYPWVGGNLFPGALSPFGAVKLSPDSVTAEGETLFNWATAGYNYADTYLLGFSHTRLSGTGSRDMGHFRVTPQVEGTSFDERLSKPLPFSHDTETATAGYYAVYLPSIGCMAELTASPHVGMHRYTFGTDKDAHIFIDSTSFLFGGRAEEGIIRVNPDTGEITGEARLFVGFSGRYDGLKAYFSAKFNKSFNSFSTWSEGESIEGRKETSGSDCGADINFGNIKNEPLELKLAISFVSLDNACENMTAEAGEKDFEGVRTAARDTWDSYLSRIDIKSESDEIKTIFYTSLYHSMTMPSTYTDVNGQYLGFNRTIGTADDFTYMSDLSLWDTYRNTHPLYILIAPEIQRSCLKSLLAMARIGGTLPRWPSGGGYTGSMFGTPADMVFAESYLKGITDFAVNEAYEFMKLTSEQEIEGVDSRKAIQEYNTLGYVPADAAKISVSLTLEYAWADGSIALLADALGKTEEAQYYREKSLNYRNLFDSRTKYFRGKNSDGSWVSPFSPDASSFYDDILGTELARPYCEGSARHWRWTAIQDTQGLLGLFGSREYFVSELNEFMENWSNDPMALDSAGGFWIGNEHNLHAPYLFNDAKRPDLTQKWVRKTLRDSFGTDSGGLAGNDDGGALSSWYVWSALGLYPAAGTDHYRIGSPNIDEACISLGNGKTLRVIAENQAEENVYVEKVTLNGERLSSSIIEHSLIANGGTLIFTMTDTPAKNGGFQ